VKLPPTTTLARLAGLGAFGMVGVLALAYAAFVLALTLPNGEGIDRIEGWVAWVSAGCVWLALEGVHIVYGRYLLGIASGQNYSIESSWRTGGNP